HAGHSLRVDVKNALRALGKERRGFRDVWVPLQASPFHAKQVLQLAGRSVADHNRAAVSRREGHGHYGAWAEHLLEDRFLLGRRRRAVVEAYGQLQRVHSIDSYVLDLLDGRGKAFDVLGRLGKQPDALLVLLQEIRRVVYVEDAAHLLEER